MKKLIISAIAALALAIPAQANTWDISKGGWENPAGSPYDGSTDVYFLNFDSQYSACQILLTPDMLTGMAPKATATELTKSKITGISVKVSNNGAYVAGGEISVTAYADNVDATSFPKEGSVEKYFAYTTDHKASAVFDESSEFAQALSDYENPVTLTINFGEEGFIYEGKSILLTVFTDYALEEYYDWYNGVYTFVSGSSNKLVAGKTSDSSMPSLTGSCENTSTTLPHILFDFEEVTESTGPTVTPGKPVSGFAIGTDSADSPNAPALRMPYNPEYDSSITQSIYTKSLLQGLFEASADGITKAAITSVKTFLNYSGYPMDEATVTLDLYAFNSDLTQFPTDGNGKELWIDYKEAAHAQLVITSETPTWDDFYNYAMDGTLEAEVIFDEPFIYEGESIILTWVMSSPDCSYLDGSFTEHHVFNPKDGVNHSGVTTGKSSVSGNLENGTKFLPYLEIGYTPLTYSGGEATPVLAFAEATPSLAAYTDAKGATSNQIKVDFTIADDSDLNSYTIKYGTRTLGTLAAKSGTVSLIPAVTVKGSALGGNKTVSYSDITLFVEADGYIAGNITIPADDIKALFTAPVAGSEPLATSLMGSYDPIHDSKIDLTAAAVIHMTSGLPVAKAAFSGAMLIYGDDRYLLDDFLHTAATSWNDACDFATVEGTFGIYSTSKITVPVEHNLPALDGKTFSWSVTPSAKYPVACMDTPVLGEPRPASVTTSEVEIAGERLTISSTADRAIVEIGITENTLRKLTIVEDDPEFLIIIAGHGHTVNYYVEDLPAEPGTQAGNGIMVMAGEVAVPEGAAWNETGKTVVALPISEHKGKVINIATVDAGNDVKETARMTIFADGSISGIADITADGTAPAEYYNLQGIRTDGPLAPGVYIRRQGTKTVIITIR